MTNLYYLCIVEEIMQAIRLNRTDTTYRNESLETWIRCIRGYRVLSAEEEEQIIVKVKQGDKEALNTLIKSNQRFLFAAARTYSKYADEILELISEGNIGLLYAIKNYDSSYGYKFISFAAYYIRRHMSEYIRTNKIVKHNIDPNIFAFIKATSEEYKKENGFDIPEWILCEKTKEKFGRDFKKDGLYLRNTSVVFDADITPQDYNGDSVIERLTYVENEAINNLYHEDFAIIAKTLVDKVCQNELEKNIIVYSYGLFNKTQLSDYEISIKHNIKEEQVSYLRKKIINRMTDFAKGKKIKLNKSKFQEKDVV